MIVEPAASCTLAAADTWRDRFAPGDKVVVLLCGGNVSLGDVAEWERRFATG